MSLVTDSKTTITYEELASRLASLKLFNKAPVLDPDIYQGLVSGNVFTENTDGEDYEEEYKEIFQWYLITPSDADYLGRITDEIIFYSEVLDEYVWGITHIGTSWSSVELQCRQQ